MPPSTVNRRSRDGCWTCRRRKKKCDGSGYPCKTCDRLGLTCEREVRLVWEDHSRRDAFRRRVRRSPKATRGDKGMDNTSIGGPYSEGQLENYDHGSSSFSCRLSQFFPHWPFALDRTESLLLDHYIQRFSTTYPTCSGPTNPFLTVFLPLATQSRVVLDSLLALSAVQTWENGCFRMANAMLKMRQRALRGSRELLVDLMPLPTGPAKASSSQMVILFASCLLLLLYEKLAGEGEENWSPHLRFIACFCTRTTTDKSWSRNDAFQFLVSLFSYNDLVRATSLLAPTLSDFYIRDILPTMPSQVSTSRRFAFPRVIARISAGDVTITDADIQAWDGRMNWFPSFATGVVADCDWSQPIPPLSDLVLTLDPSLTSFDLLLPMKDHTDEEIVSHLYRIAAMVYRRQSRLAGSSNPDHNGYTSNLAGWAVELLRLLPPGSPFETALLWPLGIVARELTMRYETQRGYIVFRLEALEGRFQMKHFGRIKDSFLSMWIAMDYGMDFGTQSTILFG